MFKVHLPMERTQVQSLVWDDPTCGKATKTASHSYLTHTPQLLKPVCLGPMTHNKRSHCNERPVHPN